MGIWTTGMIGKSMGLNTTGSDRRHFSGTVRLVTVSVRLRPHLAHGAVDRRRIGAKKRLSNYEQADNEGHGNEDGGPCGRQKPG